MEKRRLEGYDQINQRAIKYFQDWLNSNAIGAFSQEINKMTTEKQLHEDWLNLMNVCSQMKFYSVTCVQTMVRIVKEKWITNSQELPETDNKKPYKQARTIDTFSEFQHTSPYILHVMDMLTQIIDLSKQEKKPASLITHSLENDIDNAMKICYLIELFSHNKLNQMLIEKIKAPSELMYCLIYFAKQLKSEKTEKAQKLEKQMVCAMLGSL